MVSSNLNNWLNLFRTTGNIAPVQLGMKRVEVTEILGEPSDISVPSKKKKEPSIYKYGNIEFHFENDVLFLIFEENDFGVVSTCIRKHE